MITIEGTNFGFLNRSPSGRVGSGVCQATLWLSSTLIKCEAPTSFRDSPVLLSVTVGDHVGSATGVFSFNAPVLTFSSPPNGPSSGSP